MYDIRHTVKEGDYLPIDLGKGVYDIRYKEEDA